MTSEEEKQKILDEILEELEELGEKSETGEDLQTESKVIKKEEEEKKREIKFELHFFERTIMSASIGVQWCLSKDMIDYFNKEEITHLAIIVRPVNCQNNRQESRKIVMINEMMTYIDFKHPGENYVIAVPVKKRTTNFDSILDRSSKGWANNLFNVISDEEVRRGWNHSRITGDLFFNYTGEQIVPYNWDYQTEGMFTHEVVDMPADVFAPEPSKAEKEWVNFFFRHPAWDQCDFRRRRMLAYSVQPLLFAFVIFARALAATMLTLLLFKKVNWQPVFHPLMYDTDDVKSETGFNDVRIFGDINDSKNKRKGFAYWVTAWFALNPAILLLFGSCAVFGSIVWAWVYVGIFGGAVSIISLIKLKAIIKEWFERRARAAKEKAARARGEKLKLKEEKKPKKPVKVKLPPHYIDDFTVCTGTGFVPMEQLPKEKKTVRLRFQNLKNKVCKPYQG